MNFFKAQDRARRNTAWMILLLILAVCGLIFFTQLLLLAVTIYFQTGLFVSSLAELRSYFELDVFIAVAVAVSLLVFAGSLYKTMALAKGGPAVAEMLGGMLLAQGTQDLQQRQLLNVVEEMAIAAGTPIPQVYLLEESSINAFAAGRTPATAVIGITRGALALLTREELQGVIAHEFSHILNGDMRLNIRLIGVLHGILLIGMIGYFILRSLRHVRGSGSKKGGSAILVVVVLGVGLMVIGYTGTFFGQCIKSAVSRQREYLADASAVRFTRNKDSIAGALKKIGGASAGSLIGAPAAPEYSHAYFADGLSRFWGILFATHPPLQRRIKAIDPHWDGKYTEAKFIFPAYSPKSWGGAPAKKAVDMLVNSAILSAAGVAIEQIGTLNEANIEQARELIVAIPAALRVASQSAFSARAVVYAILLKHQADEKQAWMLMRQHADPAMPALTAQYLAEVRNLDDRFKLPLLELCITALRELSTNQFIRFERAIEMIISADKKIDLHEWVIQRLLLQQLNEHFALREPARAKYSNLGAVKADVETLWSLIAYVEHKDDAEAIRAFDHGKKEIGATALNIIPRQSLTLESLNRSMDKLMQLKPLVKPKILRACVGIVLLDGKATNKGIELVRTISSCLDCPMPPFRV